MSRPEGLQYTLLADKFDLEHEQAYLIADDGYMCGSELKLKMGRKDLERLQHQIGEILEAMDMAEEEFEEELRNKRSQASD